MKTFNFIRDILFTVCLVFAFVSVFETICVGEVHLYVMPHGDDIIQISAKIYDDLHSPSPPDVHLLYTGNSAESVNKARGLIADHLGVSPNNVHMISEYGPIDHKKTVMMEIKDMLVKLSPDKVFIQGWCGSHPEHEMNHIEVVKAIAMAEKSLGFKAEVYEFPTFTGAYGRLPSDPTIEELSRYWNSLIDLDPKYHRWNETIQVNESNEALKAKAEMIWQWKIDWMIELMKNYTQSERLYFISQEKYRRLGDYDYLHRPYPGEMSYEFLHSWPYTFEDLRNYTLTLDEKYGADLWTVPSATCVKKHVRIDPHSVFNGLKVCIENTSDEFDVFTLSAAWEEDRVPAGNTVGFSTWSVPVDGGEKKCVDGWIDTQNLAGYHVLWIKAESEKASLDPDHKTDYTEIPFVVDINDGEAIDTMVIAMPPPRSSWGH